MKAIEFLRSKGLSNIKIPNEHKIKKTGEEDEYYLADLLLDFALINKYIIILSILLMSCGSESETNRQNVREYRNDAQPLDSKMYKTAGGGTIEVINNLEEGYKIILWHNSYGSDMEVIDKLKR